MLIELAQGAEPGRQSFIPPAPGDELYGERLRRAGLAMFNKLLPPMVAEQTEQHGAFTAAIHRQVEMVHVVNRLTLRPLIDWAQRVAARLARMHHGITSYASHVLAVLVIVLLIASATLP